MERHAERLGRRVPDRALEAVIFARQRDGQVLQHEVVDRAAEQAVDDALYRHPIVVAVELAPPDRAVGELHLQDELGQRVELDRPSGRSGDRQHVQRLVVAGGVDGAVVGRNDDFIEAKLDDGFRGSAHVGRSRYSTRSGISRRARAKVISVAEFEKLEARLPSMHDRGIGLRARRTSPWCSRRSRRYGRSARRSRRRRARSRR